jgi:hypothetical protein
MQLLSNLAWFLLIIKLLKFSIPLPTNVARKESLRSLT